MEIGDWKIAVTTSHTTVAPKRFLAGMAAVAKIEEAIWAAKDQVEQWYSFYGRTKRSAIVTTTIKSKIAPGTEPKIRPRKDVVLIRKVRVQERNGMQVPGNSPAGYDFVVEEIGPGVEGLAIGDRVLFGVSKDGTYYDVPTATDLLLVREENVICVIEGA